jgi:glycosyltransferase involved in cell wall biosynthesis
MNFVMGYLGVPNVNILLCTHNGGAFLDAQLQSFCDQDHTDWRLWVSDDGSTDDTRQKIEAFARAHPNREVRLVDGPKQGFAANFLSVLGSKEFAGSWVSFADQDDVWMPHKLSRAVSQLADVHSGRAVYASRTLHTDAELLVIGSSPRHGRPYGFGNALVQNVLGGNTIVTPPDTTELIRETLPTAGLAKVPFHDWWIYLVTTGAGVTVVNDAEPGVFYRQHEGNIFGSRLCNRASRLRMLKAQVYAGWIDRNVAGLRAVAPLLTAKNVNMLNAFSEWRERPLLTRFQSPQSLGLYRQTRVGNVMLRALARMGRL